MPILLSIVVGMALFFMIGFVARAILQAFAPAHLKPTFRDIPLTASFGLSVILLYVVAAIFAPMIAPLVRVRFLVPSSCRGHPPTISAPTSWVETC